MRRGPLDHKLIEHRKALERCVKHLKFPRSRAMLEEFMGLVRDDVNETDVADFQAKVQTFLRVATLDEQKEFLIVMQESKEFLKYMVEMQNRMN